LLLECSIWKRKDEYDGYDEQQQQQQPQSSFDNDTKKRNNNRLEHGELILNVDDWDESKEKGQMYLHVPESFEEASATSSFDDNEYNNIGLNNEKDDNTSHEPELLFNISGYEDESPREMPQSSGRRSFGGKRRRDPVVILLCICIIKANEHYQQDSRALHHTVVSTCWQFSCLSDWVRFSKSNRLFDNVSPKLGGIQPLSFLYIGNSIMYMYNKGQ